MQDKTLFRGAVCALLVLVLASWSAAVDKTIDPTSGDFKDFQTAITWLGNQTPLTQSIVFKVTPATYKGAVNVIGLTGMSSSVTVTFKGMGGKAIIDANGAQDGLIVTGACRYYNFENLEVINFTRYGLSMTGPSSARATFCTFKMCKFDAPKSTSSSVRAAHLYYPNDCTFEDCVFAGGGRVYYTQQINRCFIRRCEFDGKGSASQLVSLWNSNDSDNLYENCFLHDCASSGYGFYVNYSQYGNMFWHNTIIINTSQVAVYYGSCCAWSRANSFRDNIVVNMGTGGCIRYGHSGGLLDYNDADYNCYYAPNGLVCELESGTTFTKGTLAQWKTFFNANRTTLIRPSGPTPAQARFDDNSIEANPGLTSMTAPYDIHLSGASPCLDAGTTQYVAGSWISYNPAYKVANDFEGDARPATNVDIGADEVAVRIIGSGSGLPGTTIVFSLFSPSDAGLPYQVGSSFGNGPIPIDTRQLELSPDALLVLSVGGLLPTIFQSYAGLLDKSGNGTAKLNIPAIPQLKGLRVYTAFLTLKASAPSGVSSISKSFLFTIQ